MYNQHRDTPLGGTNLPAPIRVSSIKLTTCYKINGMK